MLDAAMRERLGGAQSDRVGAGSPTGCSKRIERKYWSPDPEMLDVLRRAGEELEDRLEGVGMEAAA